MENKTIKILLKAAVALIMVIGIIIGGISISKGDEPGPRESLQLGIIAYNAVTDPNGDGVAEVATDKTVDAFQAEEVTRVKSEIASATHYSISYSLILFYISVGVLVIFSIVGIVKNPKGILKKLIMLGAFAILLLVVYFATKTSEEDGVPAELAKSLDITGIQYSLDGYNLASWGITASIILIILAVAAWIIGGIYSLVKK